ncbi:MAG: hypothetical protein HOH43_21960 [Candidatus Latescibacteria bacterium]|nr:hypothetical protein [Candidatus Latescibacterota bacterium]
MISTVKSIIVTSVLLVVIAIAGSAIAVEVDGVVTDGRTPIDGARVRVHGQIDFTVTDSEGRFSLSSPVDALGAVVVTAGKMGWINGGVKITASTSFTTIVLEKLPDDDDPDYEFITPHKSLVDLRHNEPKLNSLRVKSHAKFKESCNLCHFEPTCYLCHRDIYNQWSQSHHAQAVTNPWLQDMYNGTDAEGNENVGPGFRIDFPDEEGECADCHAPTAALKAPGKTDLKVVYNRGIVAYPIEIGYKSFEQKERERQAGSVDATGIHCDFCHKIKNVEVNDRAGVNGAIEMHRLTLKDEKREAEGRLPMIFAYGPYDDVINFSPVSNAAVTSPMVASYNPIYTQSEYCSSCHQHQNEFGMPFMDTYREWEASVYNEAGIECQSCHMKPDYDLGRGTFVNGDAEKFWTPVEARDLSTVKRHDFLGGAEEMVKNSATLAISAVADTSGISVDISIKNVSAGHHLPSGITLRNMLLLVTATDATGDTLAYTGSERVPDYGGIGAMEDGNYAGYPGRGFALIFGDDEGNEQVMDWQATRIVSDTRIPAKEVDQSAYRFVLSNPNQPISIHTKLIYRRAFKELADEKKWELIDITVAEDTTEIDPSLRLSKNTPSVRLSLEARFKQLLAALL